MIVCCALTLLLTAGGTMGGVFYLTERQNGRAAQALADAVALGGLQRANIVLFEGGRTDYFGIHSECEKIDPETGMADILFRVRPSVYSLTDFTPSLFLNGQRISIAWNDDESLLTARAAFPLGEAVTECRIVVEDKQGNYYQQEFPDLSIGTNAFAPAHWVFQDNLPEPNPRRVEGNTFYWNGSYLVAEEELPFGSKLASARVYAYDTAAGKEVFSYDFKKGDGELAHKVSLTPEKTNLLLYGEIIGQEGIKYRYFLGEVLWSYKVDAFILRYSSDGLPEHYYRMPGNDSGLNGKYNLHVTFLNGTTRGLRTF